MSTPPSVPQQPTPSPDRPRHQVVAAASAVVGVIAVALAVLLWSRARPSFGWFAYAPLSDTTFMPAVYPTLVTALVVGALGLLLVGAAVGIVVGRRLR